MAGVKAAGNATVTYNSNNVTAYINDATLQMAIDELETTNLASTGKEFIPGMGDYTIDLPFAYWDSTLDGYLYADAITPGTLRTAAIAYTDSGGTTVTYTWTSKAFVTNYSIGGGATAVLGGSAALRLVGAPSRATS